jgi:hypothetical protein
MLSALGAIVLAISVFLPWYALSITAEGVAFVQQVGTQFVSQFGNAQLQGELGSLHAGLSGLAGHQLAAVSAHQVLTNISVVLLIAAGLGILITLFVLAGPQGSVSDQHGSLIALLGAIAAICVLYRILAPPSSNASYLALSLREGAWLALLGSLAMVVGGLWPRRLGARTASQAKVEGVWSGLSGWTPEG